MVDGASNLGRPGYGRGFALLATLLAIALMTVLVVDFTTSTALGYRAAANQADEMRAYYLARSGINVGLAILAQDTINDAQQQNPYDGLNEAWAQPAPPIPVSGGVVALSIIDEARKIDINLLWDPQKNAINPVYEGIIARLFTNLGVSTELVPVIEDWLDPDSIESPGGAEADYYLKLTPPYEPRNSAMPTIGDMRMLKGMDDATFMRLSHYLTTMPEQRVNANTAPPEVLAALIPEFENDPDLVKEIIAARDQRPFTTNNDINNLPGIGQFTGHLGPLLTTRSSYFTINGQGDFAGARKRIYSTFRRNTNGTAMLMNWHED
jgi:general secretion pathway protein K